MQKDGSVKDIVNEVWRTIPGWESKYQVSNLGRVRSKSSFVKTFKSGKGHTRKGRILRPVLKSGRYLAVSLTDKKRRFQIAVHRLVLLAFKAPRKKGHVSRHLNGNSLDNRTVNLTWGSQAENLKDRIKHGTHLFGALHPKAKIAEWKVKKIKSGQLKNLSSVEVAKKLKTSVHIVHQIRSGRTWKHIK